MVTDSNLSRQVVVNLTSLIVVNCVSKTSKFKKKIQFVVSKAGNGRRTNWMKLV